MGLKKAVNNRQDDLGKAISFGEKYIASSSFKAVFSEGMALVEEAAAYLEGPGRRQSKSLPPELSFAYATESMRLTTRLMQLASWLLIRRAVNEGEMSSEQAEEQEHKVKLQSVASLSRARGFEKLPAEMIDLVERSLRFYERIVKLDSMIRASQAEGEKDLEKENSKNPVDRHMGLLKAAFEGNN